VCCVELEERARLLKQRLNIKTGDGGIPFSDSEVSGHRSRPRDSRKSASRSGGGGGGGGGEGGGATDFQPPQRGSGAGTWNKMQSGDRSSPAAVAGRHAARSSSSSYRHDHQRRNHAAAADVHADRSYRRHGIIPLLILIIIIIILIQRFNAVAVLGTFAPTTPEEDV